MATCNICIKRVLNHSYHLTCDFCKGTVHLKCLPSVNKNDSLYTNRDKSVFYCSICLRDIFAYNRLDDEDFIEALAESWENQPLVSFETLENQELIFSPFDFNDNFDNPLHDADPDIQFYNNHYSGSLQACDDYLENMFNDKIKKSKISNQSFSLYIERCPLFRPPRDKTRATHADLESTFSFVTVFINFHTSMSMILLRIHTLF